MMKMKTYKGVMSVIISMFFIMNLCPQAWAKKQAGPTPGPKSVNDLKKYEFVKVISADRLDIKTKIVGQGDTLSFRDNISCSEIKKQIKEDEEQLENGDKKTIVV